MKAQIKLTEGSKTKLQKLFLVFLVGCTCGLLIVRLITANSFVDDSQQVGKIEVESQKLAEKNELLTSYIQKNSSLVNLRSKAFEIGMQPTSNYTYLPSPANMALAPLLKFQ